MGRGWGCRDLSSAESAIEDSDCIDRVSVEYRETIRVVHAFLASLRCFLCFAALAFSILWRSRTGVRLDLGSWVDLSNEF